MVSAFDTALDTLERLAEAPVVHSDAVNDALRVLSTSRTFPRTADQYRRLFPILYRYSGIQDPPLPVEHRGEDRFGVERIGWHMDSLFEHLVTDVGAFNRRSIEQHRDHRLGLGKPLREGWDTHYIPAYNVPLDVSELATMLAPYFAAQERAIAKEPTHHLKLCWDVFHAPLPPFPAIFSDWLVRLDEKGLGHGNEAPAFEKARAYHSLASRGVQRTDWGTIERHILPDLEHPHPMVAGNAAAFFGGLMAEADARIHKGPDWTLPQVLGHLARLPVHRRVASGGFLQGFDVGHIGPLGAIRKHPQVQAADFDVDAWVLAVLSDGTDEPYVPGSQAFWFYLHEDYCYDPSMVLRMVEVGHHWIAWMCITELAPPVEGMEEAARRLAAKDPDTYGEAVAHWLTDLPDKAP